MEVDFPQVIAHKNAVSKQLTGGVAGLLKANKVVKIDGKPLERPEDRPLGAFDLVSDRDASVSSRGKQELPGMVRPVVDLDVPGCDVGARPARHGLLEAPLLAPVDAKDLCRGGEP